VPCPHLPPPRDLLAKLLLAIAALLFPAGAAATQAPPEGAARHRETTISFPELDHLLLGRFALSKVGRETRLFLLKMRVIEAIAEEYGVIASEAEVDSMAAEIEKGVVAAGKANDLDDYLRRQKVPLEEFRESLRLAVLQQTLARRALGIPENQPISGEQQEMWIERAIGERGLEEFDAPWKDGVILTCGGVSIRRDEFLVFLRKRLDPVELRDALIGLLRVKAMRARMPDLTDGALATAVEEEIQGRRNEVMSDPRYQGIGYGQLLESQGILMDFWPSDPEIVGAALARLWVARSYDEGALRALYEDEREYFDGEFGEAVETWVIFFRAAQHPNELIPRGFEAAEKELYDISREIKSKEAFEAKVSSISEDRASREKKGFLGWVTRLARKGPNPARRAIFKALDSGAYKPGSPKNSPTRLIGPVRTKTGVLLLWLGERRPVPSWSSMLVYVHRELRKRFADQALAEEEIWTFLDGDDE
jgi:hypothetical protein